MSMLLIPRDIDGIMTCKIEIGVGGMGAMTYITFEDVKVPASYIIGKEGLGFNYTMSNFNHERLWIAGSEGRKSVFGGCIYVVCEEGGVWEDVD